MRKRLEAFSVVIVALLAMVTTLNVISWVFGQSPASMLTLAFKGSLGTPYGFGQVLFKATPLIFTGLAFDLALRAKLFNIGAEGQLAVAGLTAGWLASHLPPGIPSVFAVPLVLAAGMGAGATWALVPALLRAFAGAHELITTLMMNRIADGVVPWILATAIGSSDLRTGDAVEGARLLKLERWSSALRGSACSMALALALAATGATAYFLRHTRIGREIVATGLNEHACAAEGIPVKARTTTALLMSGALAGATASATVLGYKGYYEYGLGAGAGFAGIAVALLGQGRPWGIALAALLFGTLEQAGLAVNAKVPKDAMTLLEAVVIVAVAAAVGLRRWKESEAAS